MRYQRTCLPLTSLSKFVIHLCLTFGVNQKCGKARFLCYTGSWSVKTSQGCRGELGFSKGGGHTVSHPGYLHGPLQMFGPENGVCNYLALEMIYGMLILWIHTFRHLNYKFCMLFT